MRSFELTDTLLSVTMLAAVETNLDMRGAPSA